mgnify:CR=1 FL=1
MEGETEAEQDSRGQEAAGIEAFSKRAKPHEGGQRPGCEEERLGLDDAGR